MKVWYNGSITIPTTLDKVIESTKAMDNQFVEATKLYPGMYSVECVQHGDDFVTIQTNEGLMERSNIVISQDEQTVTIDFDELYGNKLVKVKSHYTFAFQKQDKDVLFTCTISILSTKGFLGVIYKLFSKNSIGKAMLASYKKLFTETK